jgi:hypothetical protein
MTNIVRRRAFDRPFAVRLVKGEILAQSDQAPIELAFTPEAARKTADRLLIAVREAEEPTSPG